MSTNVIQADFQPTPSNPGTSDPELRTAASVLLERMQFLRAAGLSFKGQRDLYDILGYDRVISPGQYRLRYDRGGIAGRVVDAMPKATWRGGGEIIEDEDPKVSTALEETWAALNERLKLWSVFEKVDILAAQGRYAVIFLGMPGDFDTELKKGKPEQLLYVTLFAEEDAKIMSWELDEKNARFGLPTSYQLSHLTANSLSMYGSPNVPAFTAAALQKPVHWTRVIHIPAEGTLDNEVFGKPALERVWNLLDDLDKVTGGGAEAFWLRANQGMLLNIDKEIKKLEPEQKADLQNQIDEYQHQIRRVLRTHGVNVETLGSDVANFSNPADAILTQIAGSKSIPKRILTGSEMGELASSQDRENFRDQINGRQTGYAGPYVVRPFVDRCIAYRILPEPKKGPEKYQVLWPHVQVLTEAEKSEGASKWASVNSSEGMPVFLNREIRDKWYGLPPLTEKDLQDELKLKQASQPAPPPGLEPGAPGQVDENGNPIPANADPTLKTKPPQAGGNNAEPDDNPDAAPAGSRGRGRTLPFTPRAGEAAPAELEALVSLLEQAIRTGNTGAIDQVLGVKHVQGESTIVMPSIDIHTPSEPTRKVVHKTIEYGDVQGTIRPVGITEVLE